MPKYPPHRAGRVNLVVGIALVLLSVLALISVIANNVSGSTLGSSVIFMLLFMFIGGYEIGKYAENRISKQYRAIH